jgi:hypothetical protein
MATRNLIAAIGLIALALWYGVLASGLPERGIPNTPGPSFFPWIITASLAILATALLVQGLRAARRSDALIAPGRPVVLGAVALTAFVIYLALLSVLGFLIASVPFFAGLMALYGERRPVWLVVGSVACPAALFVLFRHLFQIPLPRGLLPIFGG